MTRTEDFLIYLQAEKRYSEDTIKAYRTVLNQFHAFCQNQGEEGMDLHFRTIRSWEVSQLKSGISARTMHKKLSALSTFSKYLIRQGELDSNPVDKVLKPKINKRTPVFVEEHHMEELPGKISTWTDLEVKAARNPEEEARLRFNGIRDMFVIELLYQTGMRRAELLSLGTGSIDMGGKYLRVIGKRDKERLIPLNDELLVSIENYLAERNQVVRDSGTDSLIVTFEGKPASKSLIYDIVRKCLAVVTTLDKKSPHVLRHTFATHMLNKGADLNAIKELLGHSNLAATQVYTQTSLAKLKEIYKQAHPRAEKEGGTNGH